VRVPPTEVFTPVGSESFKPDTAPPRQPPALPKSMPAWAWLAGGGLAAVACLLTVVWFLTTVISPPRTPAPPTMAAITSSPFLVQTQAVVIPTSPLEAINTEASFTPTLRVIPTTVIPTQRVDEKGVAIALIPAGEFQMGSQSGISDEHPVHPVYLDAYYIDVYEVTNTQYANCVEFGSCSLPHITIRYQAAQYAQHPVVYVDWSQAQAYCQWRGGDLPSEAQWEKAARGRLQGKLYPWGDEAPVCEKGARNGAKFDDNAVCDRSGTEPVGNYSPNGYGLFDMAGNVWEWVLDWYLATFYARSSSKNPSGPAIGYYRMLRGGSWLFDGSFLRVANRNGNDPINSGISIGFRCSRLP